MDTLELPNQPSVPIKSSLGAVIQCKIAFGAILWYSGPADLAVLQIWLFLWAIGREDVKPYPKTR